MARRWKILIVVALVVLTLDQWSKFLAVKHLTPGIVDAIAERPTGWSEREAILENAGLGEQLGVFFSSVKHPCRRTGAECRRIEVAGELWRWQYVQNPGAAWGLLAKADASIRVPFFFVVSLLAIGFIIVFFRKLEEKQKLTIWALSLVFGGAVGNLVDRLHLSYVIDFIDWGLGTSRWPTFNVADSAISVGVSLLMLEWLLDSLKKNREEKPLAEETAS